MNLHVHWHKYVRTIAQVADMQYFDEYRCRCGRFKMKWGLGYSPYYWWPKHPITGELLDDFTS